MNVLPISKRAEVVAHLTDGSGVRTSSRLCRVHKNTVSSLVLKVGQGYLNLHNKLVRGLRVHRIEADELFTNVLIRQANLPPNCDDSEIGEQWVWVGMATASKLAISLHVGKRTAESADIFARDLRARLATIPFICTDGLLEYVDAIKAHFRGAADHARVVKNFGRKKDYDKVAPPRDMVSIEKRVGSGDPDLEAAGTSYVERFNLTLRHYLRRLTRRSPGYSKSLRHLRAMLAIFMGVYNFVRPHSSLRCTPAMEAGLTDHEWTMEEFVEACLEAEPCPLPAPRALEPHPEAAKRKTETKPAEPGAMRTTSTGAVLRAVQGGKGRPTIPKKHIPALARWVQYELFDGVDDEPPKLE